MIIKSGVRQLALPLGEQLIYRDDPADCSTPDLTRLAHDPFGPFSGREPMKSRSMRMIVAALAAMISASPAQAGGLQQVTEISIPGDPIAEG